MLAAALCAAPGPSWADPPARGAPAVTGQAAPSLDPEKRRDPAEYRGRKNHTTAGEALSWIPRVLLFPLFGVTEYGLRQPIYATAEVIDRHHVVPIVDHWLHPTPDISWAPTLSLDLSGGSVEAPERKDGEPRGDGGAKTPDEGAKIPDESLRIVPFVGLQGKYSHLFVPGHELSASAETGGERALRFTGRDEWRLGASMFVGVRGEYSTRPDRAFYGLGSRSSLPTKFSLTRSEGFLFAGFEPGPHLRLEVSQGFRGDLTGSGDRPSIESHFDTSRIPGFGEVRLAMVMIDLTLDSRDFPEESEGVRLAFDGTFGRDVSVVERSFLSAEADAEGALEISRPDRVLAARIYAMDTQPLGKEEVPFMQLATLGWDRHHGFVLGRFRGESALMAQLQYRYPIAYFIDAQWTASVGNVFSQHFGDFDPAALTASFGVGLRTRRSGMPPMQLTFAVGTTRFDEPFRLDAVRVYFGKPLGL